VPFELIAIVKSMQERNVLALEDLFKPAAPITNDEQSLIDASKDQIRADELPPLILGEGETVGATDSPNVGTTDGEEKSESESEDEDEEEEEIKVLVTEAAPVDTSCMSIGQAYSIYPKTNVEDAIAKELQNMIDMGVFGPIERGSDIPKKMIIPSKFFLKDKGSNGTVELKGRFVGGGHRQDETIYERKSSPTASPQTIFISLMDAAEKKKSVLVGDVPCAYLHASRENLPKVYVRLSREITEVFVKLCPEYAERVEADETLIVEVLKGLYGLIESGHTWYTHFISFLTSIGFTVCKYDECVLKFGDITLVIYVDDLLLTGPEEGINEVMDLIEKEFGDCKRMSGPIFKFIGMEFEIKNDGVAVKIDLKNLLKDTVGSVDTPCGNNILVVSENVEKLTDTNKEKLHSVIAKLLYVSKRTRPEILFGVNFLCTRVQDPTVEDAVKLGRIMKYLKGSEDDELFLKIVRVNGVVTMEAYIDASYGVHQDSKSHSGMVLTMGIGSLVSISTKQKCVSKSSTEAELIAVTDLVGLAFNMKRLAEEIIGEQIKLVVYQDNESTMKLMKNGSTGARSKHIKIRFAWIK